jgi:hypothetical protein
MPFVGGCLYSPDEKTSLSPVNCETTHQGRKVLHTHIFFAATRHDNMTYNESSHD